MSEMSNTKQRTSGTGMYLYELEQTDTVALHGPLPSPDVQYPMTHCRVFLGVSPSNNRVEYALATSLGCIAQSHASPLPGQMSSNASVVCCLIIIRTESDGVTTTMRSFSSYRCPWLSHPSATMTQGSNEAALAREVCAQTLLARGQPQEALPYYQVLREQKR